MTTKFPACAVLVNLATVVKRMSMKVVVEWTPRSGNREADQLANGRKEKHHSYDACAEVTARTQRLE